MKPPKNLDKNRTNQVWPETGHPKSGQIEFGFFEKYLFRYLLNVKHIKID